MVWAALGCIMMIWITAEIFRGPTI